MYATTEEAVREAQKVKAKYGYSAQAVICKTQYKAGTYHLGFHFDSGRSVGDTGIHPDGSSYEIVAIV